MTMTTAGTIFAASRALRAKAALVSLRASAAIAAVALVASPREGAAPATG